MKPDFEYYWKCLLNTSGKYYCLTPLRDMLPNVTEFVLLTHLNDILKKRNHQRIIRRIYNDKFEDVLSRKDFKS